MPSVVSKHGALIDDLGGPKQLSDTLRRRNKIHITPQAITLWKRRGVAWKHRQLIAKIAAESGVSIPSDFTIA